MQPRDGLAQRALARPVFAHQRMNFTGVELDRHITERLRDDETL